jgi:hypothetical protein
MRIELKTKILYIFTETTKHQKEILAMILGSLLVAYALWLGYDSALVGSWLGVLGYIAGKKTSKKKKESDVNE